MATQVLPVPVPYPEYTGHLQLRPHHAPGWEAVPAGVGWAIVRVACVAVRLYALLVLLCDYVRCLCCCAIVCVACVAVRVCALLVLLCDCARCLCAVCVVCPASSMLSCHIFHFVAGPALPTVTHFPCLDPPPPTPLRLSSRSVARRVECSCCCSRGPSWA